MKAIYRSISVVLVILSSINGIAQENQEKYLKNILNAKAIVWDPNNGDGVFLAQHKKTKKWGMYQSIEAGKRPTRLVSMRYDSLGFFAFNVGFTIAKKNGKYGVVEANWSGSGGAELLRCKYEMLRYVYENGVEMVASRQNGKWGYLDYKTGDTLIPFEHNKFSELPQPSRTFYKHPLKAYPEKLKTLLAKPDTVTQIDLSYLKLEYLPSAIGKCINAEFANLEGNQFRELPDEFFQLKKLKTIFMGGNPKLITIDKRFAQLTSLETLIIGRITRYGKPEAYLVTNMYFEEELAGMQNLKFLAVRAYFSDYSVPEFVHHLPNLEYLEISSRSSKPLQYDLSKLTCKKSLKEISLNTIDNLQNWNANIHKFPNLEEFSMTIENMKDGLESIMKIPKLRDIYVTAHTLIEGSNYFEINTVMDYSLNKEVLTTEQRKEAIEKWRKFISKDALEK